MIAVSKEATALEPRRNFQFDIRQTNIAKGISLLMLLWHHLFYNSAAYYKRFTTMHLYKGVPIECTLSVYCKVCVSAFVLLSGYGLYLSWQKYEKKMIQEKGRFTFVHQLIFVKNHLLKLMFNFWFVYILFVPLSIFIGTPFWEVYKGNFWYGLADFMGMATFFKTPTMNGTWWFMSTIILLYLLFPLMMFIMKRSPEILVALSVLLTFSTMFYKTLMRMTWFSKLTWLIQAHDFICRYYVWLIPFTIGMYLARYRLLERVRERYATTGRALALCCTMLLACIAVRLYLRQKQYFDSIFAIAVILFAYLILSRIPYLSKALEQLGIYSGVIFMFHTFIFSRYFPDFIYGFKYAIPIYLVLTVICYLVAVGMKYLKKLIRYDKLAKKLTT